MAHLDGHSANIQMVMAANPATAPSVGASTTAATTSGTGAQIIDGTPVRVAVLALAAAGGLLALKMAGLRFNVGVST